MPDAVPQEVNLNESIAAEPSQAIDQPIFCPACGYDVRGASRNECPECGAAVDLDALKESQIPWAFRQEIGRFRAYCRTFWLVTFRTKQFCEELVRPVDFKTALSFRRVTVALAYASIVGMILFPLWLQQEMEWNEFNRAFGESSLAVFIVVELICLALFLFVLTGVHTYWFHPSSLDVTRQNRAVATSYYACAPLGLLVLSAPLWVFSFLLIRVNEDADSSMIESIAVIFIVAACIIFLLAFSGFWLAMNQMCRRGLRPNGWLAAMFTVGMPILWLVLAAVMLAGIPLAVAFVWAMLYSMVG